MLPRPSQRRRLARVQGFDDGRERCAVHVLHSEVGHAVRLAEREERHDRRMRGPRDGLGFATESIARAVEPHRLGTQDLEGDDAAERFLERAMDDAHAAADLLEDAELAQSFGRAIGRCAG